MFESPYSLQERCVNFVSDNLSAVCDIQETNDDQLCRYVFKDTDFYFHCDISEQLFLALCRKGKLNDQTITLFHSGNTKLRHVRIFNASSLTIEGLRVLKSHKISKLEANGLRNISVNDLIGCLGDWSLQNLRLLNVANSTFMNISKFYVLVGLSKLRNLETLNVSYTEFNKHGLDIIMEDLLNLRNLDISNTRVTDITPLLKCCDRLQSLAMYNLKTTTCSEVSSTLFQLTKLQHLDISSDKPEHNHGTQIKYRVSEFLKQPNNLLNLTSIDISGKQDIEMEDLR